MKLPEPDLGDVQILVDMIRQAEKPLLISGGGVVRGRADREFTEFAEKMDAPVAITLMGAGGFRGRNPLTTGMIGMHGTQASNIACDSCDSADRRRLPVLRPGRAGPEELCQPGKDRPDRH